MPGDIPQLDTLQADGRQDLSVRGESGLGDPRSDLGAYLPTRIDVVEAEDTVLRGAHRQHIAIRGERKNLYPQRIPRRKRATTITSSQRQTGLLSGLQVLDQYTA